MDLQTRAKNILMQPAQEWPVIAGESTDVTALLRDYAAPLSAIPAVCRWIGMSVIGVSVPFIGTVRVGIVRGLASAIVTWVLSLVGAWLAALVIEKLAPSFGSRGDTAQALKLVVYASTAIWIAGVLNLIPALSILTLLAGLYAIYLFYLGLTPVMQTPNDKVVPYMIVSALVVIVVTVVVGFCAAALVAVS
jgi:hypothetical protein